MNVLIIEDEAFSAMVTMAFFKDEGHVVTHASSSEEAIESLEECVPDIVISDWNIQGNMSPVDIALKIRSLNKSVKLAFVTGHNLSRIQDELVPLLPYSYYTKPVDIEKLLKDLTN